MSDTPTFRLGDLVWIAEAIDYGNDFALRHGIVKKVTCDGLRVTVEWIDVDCNGYMTTEHIANNLAVTADEAIQKFLEWAKNVLNVQKHAYEKEALEKLAKTQANDTAPVVLVYGLDEDQLRNVIAAIKEKP